MSNITEFELDWEGIKILIKHTHKAWGVIEHIELHSIDPPEAELPMTDTELRLMAAAARIGLNSSPKKG